MESDIKDKSLDISDPEESDSFISPAYSPVSQEKLEQIQNNKRKIDDKSNDNLKKRSGLKIDKKETQDSKISKNNEDSPKQTNTNHPNLPEGWTYKKLIRKNGPSQGKIEFHVFSPEGIKFRTLTKLKQFLNKTLKYQHIEVESYDFFKFGSDKTKSSLNKKQLKPMNKNKKEGESSKTPVKKQLRRVLRNPSKITISKRKSNEEQKKGSNSNIENLDNKQTIELKRNLILPTSPNWIPPKSPYKLIQENLYHEPWQLLIASIFLNCTKGNIALPLIEKFLEKWPYPRDIINTDQEEVEEFIKPIGREEIRAYQIKRFTDEFLNKSWKYPKELFGIGKYGNDSYRIFCINEWKLVRPDDMRLTMYLNWLWTNHEYLEID